MNENIRVEKIGIMQPYFLPYIGYFQIIMAVDLFVFYDDVQFIKGGWINRNRIIINNELRYLTIPLKDASANKLIKDTFVKKDQKDFLIIEKKIEQCYKKAPFFSVVFPLIQTVMKGDYKTISELSISSIEMVSKYLLLSTKFVVSSEKFADTSNYKRSERLARICHTFSAKTYINAVGGQELYDKEGFLRMGIKLQFLKSQNSAEGLIDNNLLNVSILHLLMYYSPARIKILLQNYKLI